MFVEDFHGFESGFLILFYDLFVVRVTTNKRAEPVADRWEYLVVDIRHPSYNGRVVLLRLAEQAGLFVLGCDFQPLAT